MNPIIVIHHNADFDGLFCREIAKKYFDEHYPGLATYVGWNYGDPVPEVPRTTKLYMLDISVDGLMDHPGLVWIDHHKTAMEKFSKEIEGYRIDGVAACRLAWQYFFGVYDDGLPSKEHYLQRLVPEPYAVTLAGEYDIWDKHDPNADILQFGLRSRELTETDWDDMLQESYSSKTLEEALAAGAMLQKYQQRMDSGLMSRSFMQRFEGLNFLCLTVARCNSLTFMSKDVPETGHDALMGFYYDGQKWNVSMYHARHRTDLDLSAIAVKYGGGGHRGACGFNVPRLPFIV